jgi:hypothetical protein
MFDDDENKPDSDSSSSDDSSSSSGSVEGSEPPPAGDDSEPAPAGESSSSDDASDKPLEDNEGHSDSSAETDSSDKPASDSSSSSSDSSDSSSSDSSSADQSVQPPSEDDVSSALTRALEGHNVPMDDSVQVTLDSGLYKLAVRLSSSFNPLPQVHDETQSLQDGSVQGAAYLLQGAVQIIGDQVRVTLRIVSVETSEILQASSADGSGSSSVLDAITGAAGDALAGLPALNAS